MTVCYFLLIFWSRMSPAFPLPQNTPRATARPPRSPRAICTDTDPASWMPRRPRNVPLTDTERGVEHGYGDEKPKLTNHLQNVADMYGRLAEHTMVIAEAEAWVPTTTNTREVPERDYLLDALSARDASRQVRIAKLRTPTLTTVLPGSMYIGSMHTDRRAPWTATPLLDPRAS